LGDRVVRREIPEGMTLGLDPSGEAPRLGSSAVYPLQRLRLQVVDLVVVDVAQGVQRLRGRPQRLGIGGDSFITWNVFDVQVERVEVAARRRVVRAWLLMHGGRLRAEGTDQQDRRALASRPAAEAPQVRQVAYAPALLRPDRVDLDGPPPRACRRWGADDRL